MGETHNSSRIPDALAEGRRIVVGLLDPNLQADKGT
jgi:hypothetical protein